MDPKLIDYYELLEISPNANVDTIDRIFRYLAQRYHPDNIETANPDRFMQLVEAHEVLRDPVKRASYDVQYKNAVRDRWALQSEAMEYLNSATDSVIQSKILAVLYVKRRREFQNPGVGNLDIARLVDCPQEYLDFHLWYLKEKGWINRMEDGRLAITVEGIDYISSSDLKQQSQYFLTDQSEPGKEH